MNTSPDRWLRALTIIVVVMALSVATLIGWVRTQARQEAARVERERVAATVGAVLRPPREASPSAGPAGRDQKAAADLDSTNRATLGHLRPRRVPVELPPRPQQAAPTCPLTRDLAEAVSPRREVVGTTDALSVKGGEAYHVPEVRSREPVDNPQLHASNPTAAGVVTPAAPAADRATQGETAAVLKSAAGTPVKSPAAPTIQVPWPSLRIPAPVWCDGAYDPARGTNFARCDRDERRAGSCK